MGRHRAWHRTWHGAHSMLTTAAAVVATTGNGQSFVMGAPHRAARHALALLLPFRRAADRTSTVWLVTNWRSLTTGRSSDGSGVGGANQCAPSSQRTTPHHTAPHRTRTVPYSQTHQPTVRAALMPSSSTVIPYNRFGYEGESNRPQATRIHSTWHNSNYASKTARFIMFNFIIQRVQSLMEP